jgi:hypothetical protein
VEWGKSNRIKGGGRPKPLMPSATPGYTPNAHNHELHVMTGRAKNKERKKKGQKKKKQTSKQRAILCLN